MPSQSLLFGLVMGGLVGLVLGTTMGYRWGRATTRYQDWRRTVKGLPAVRQMVFELIGRALNPTTLLLVILILGGCWVYVQGRVE